MKERIKKIREIEKLSQRAFADRIGISGPSVARLESGNLAGSTLRFAKGLKNVQELTGKPLSELVKATSWNQAQSLGLYDLGKVAPGYTADLVLLDAEYDIVKTIIDGEVRYEA